MLSNVITSSIEHVLVECKWVLRRNGKHSVLEKSTGVELGQVAWCSSHCSMSVCLELRRRERRIPCLRPVIQGIYLQ
jgi:hypothetical protein